MKAGIITLQYFDNYGSVLQTFASQHFLEKQGVKADIINYQPTYPNNISVYFQGFLNAYHESGLTRALWISLGYVRKLLKSSEYSDIYKKKIFDEFRERYLKLSADRYISEIELISNPPEYDVYITGSDNLWLVDYVVGIPNRRIPYYLTFSPPGSIRVSYAVSMGNPDIRPKHISSFLELIENIDHISVRGLTTAEKLKSITNKDVVSVLDPTFLLTKDEWESVFLNKADNRNTRPYILVYVLYPLSQNSPLYQYVQKTALENNWDIEYVGYTFSTMTTRNRFVSVEEFFNLISNSEMIVTNSFHGTAFSIIFRKPFYTFPPQEGRVRITDLLSSFHLLDRFIDEGREIRDLDYSLDYHTSEEYIEKERRFSKNWLLSAINCGKSEDYI